LGTASRGIWWFEGHTVNVPSGPFPPFFTALRIRGVDFHCESTITLGPNGKRRRYIQKYLYLYLCSREKREMERHPYHVIESGSAGWLAVGGDIRRSKGKNITETAAR
jgi:hypothetical protein